MSERIIKVGLCGFGVVGQGVFDHLDRKRTVLSEQLGAEIIVTRIAVRNLRKARDIAVDASIVTDDPLAVAMDPEIDVICELMGGTGIAREVVLAALKAGKIVITANKALICDLAKNCIRLRASMEGICFSKPVSLGEFRLSRRFAKVSLSMIFRVFTAY